MRVNQTLSFSLCLSVSAWNRGIALVNEPGSALCTLMASHHRDPTACGARPIGWTLANIPKLDKEDVMSPTYHSHAHSPTTGMIRGHAGLPARGFLRDLQFCFRRTQAACRIWSPKEEHAEGMKWYHSKSGPEDGKNCDLLAHIPNA